MLRKIHPKSMQPPVSLRLVPLVFAAAVSNASGAVLFSENFESLPLGPYVSPSETGGDGTDWTDVAPAGWLRDQTTTPAGGPAEFFGWTFHDLQSWINTEGNQERATWVGGVGTVMVADPDAYDDITNIDDQLFNVRITTPPIPLTGVVANSVNISFDSSFRAEVTQIASLDVSLDGGSTFSPLFTLDSNVLPDGALFNDPVSLPVSNGSTGNMLFRFNMLNASNDWWWAIDNISVTGDLIPEPTAAVLGLAALAGVAGTRRRRPLS
jgi:MYXO-CTERM domain-containing protein